MPGFFDINIGQVIDAGVMVVAAVYGLARLSAGQTTINRILERHEDKLEDHEVRLNEHGERIAAIGSERRRR